METSFRNFYSSLYERAGRRMFSAQSDSWAHKVDEKFASVSGNMVAGQL